MPARPCINARDTITKDEGKLLANYFDRDGDTGYTVSSSCRQGSGTWVAWYDFILADRIAHSGDPGYGDPNKEDWPEHIASTAPAHAGYFPDDGSGPFIFNFGVDPVFDWTTIPVTRESDGCGYWFVVGDLYENYGRTDMLGWGMNVLDVQVRSDDTNVWVIVTAQEGVKYPYLYGGGYADRCGHTHPTLEEYWDSGFSDPFVLDGTHFWLYGHTGFSSGPPLFPWYDDAGTDLSFRWYPARVTVYAGDIGGFNQIDTLEAVFSNMATIGGLLSRPECAASPAEPGVMHLLWAEGGYFGTRTINPSRGQRINYSRWTANSKDIETDLRYADAVGAPSQDNSSTLWLPSDQLVYTSEMILRNDHGAPIAIVWPPDQTADETFQLSNAAEFWDLSAGTDDVLQTMPLSLVPTDAETGQGDNLIPSGPGFLRQHFASQLYTDPLASHRDVYLVCANFSGVAAFYRIPCDGSDGFDYMDGLRQTWYSIMPVDLSGFYTGFIFDYDFAVDAYNIWMPTNYTIYGGAINHLTRQCNKLWEVLPAFADDGLGSGYEIAEWGLNGIQPAIVTDDDGDDWVVAGSYGRTPVGRNTLVGAAWAKICRCCIDCFPKNLHIWQRF